MSNAEMARALSMATRECSGNPGRPNTPCHGVDGDGEYTHTLCGGTGRVFTLDPTPQPDGEYRIRRKCTNVEVGAKDKHDEWCCGGSGWFTTLLLPDGRIDVDLLITMLEEISLVVGRLQGWCEHGEGVSCWRIATKGVVLADAKRLGHNPALALAAMQALKIEMPA